MGCLGFQLIAMGRSPSWFDLGRWPEEELRRRAERVLLDFAREEQHSARSGRQLPGQAQSGVEFRHDKRLVQARIHRARLPGAVVGCPQPSRRGPR